MPHDVSIIATFAVGFVLAFVFAWIATRLRLPPLVGYLIAGVVIGRYASDMVATGQTAAQFADIGVILLMFGVGLHFSIADLMAVRRIVVVGAIVQIAIATTVGVLLAQAWGWSPGAGLVLGLCLSIASTVVVLKGVEERNEMASANGRIAIGWLVVEDLTMVMVLVLLPALAETLGGRVPAAAGEHGLLASLGLTLVKVAAFGAIVLTIGPRLLPWILRHVARTGSRELFTLAVLALSLGIAFGSAELFGVSFALGAFFAGVVLNESDLSHKAAANSLPLQDAFAVLFFVSVGMLFDPSILWREPLMVGATLAFILVVKVINATAIILAMGFPIGTASYVAAATAQIGEFSFILAALGGAYALLPPEGLSLLLAGSIISITLNQLVFAARRALLAGVLARPALAHALEQSRAARFALVERDLENARIAAQAKAAARRTLTPEELVEHIPMFATLTPEQREVVLMHLLPHTAQPGERVIRRGDRADAAYFISSGEVEVSVADRRISLVAGDFFGEMALITGEPRTADVTALDYCEFLKLTTSDFAEILRRYPGLREQIVQRAEERARMNRDRGPAQNATGSSEAATSGAGESIRIRQPRG
jgi:CPA2 family monovalent cation:H+ antiporter-2